MTETSRAFAGEHGAMNNWDKIWKKRTAEIENRATVFEMFKELKRADGFDTQDVQGYYEAFFRQWECMAQRIETGCAGTIGSLYEIGCGSGVNLYLFSTLKHVAVLSGLDYSKNLIRIAQSVVLEADVGCEEALRVPTEPKYDVVLADSVFQYFNDAAYGQKVLERMWAKTEKMVVVTEVHDQEKKDEHMAYRRKCVENYDEVYAGLDKTFYTREMFLQFAEEHGGRCEIVQPDNELYWNNRFVIDCYLYKE